jgi:long-chain fatty acid transport protein
MTNKISAILAGLSVIFISSFPQNTFAGGLSLYEQGTPGVGLGSAGEPARAQDPSTLFSNPAGMTNLEGSQLLLGAQPLYGEGYFDRSEDTSVDGSSSGNIVGFVPGSSFFYTREISEDLRFGFGTFSYFGLPLDFDNEWSGRYYSQDSTLLGLTAMPALAYKVNDMISVGAGLNAMYGMLKQQMAINTFGPDSEDGKFELEDGDWGFGGNAGVMVNFSEKTRVGLRYISQVDLDFEDRPSVDGLRPVPSTVFDGSRKLDLGVTVPTDLMLGLYHELDEKWAVLASSGWQDWSKFGRVDVDIYGENASGGTTVEIPTKDTWHVGTGLQYKATPEWLLSTGVSYDSSMIDDNDRTVSMPIGSIWRLGAGAQYAFSEKLTLGLAYQAQLSGDLPVDQERGPLAGRIDGEYDNAVIHILAISAHWKLG